MMKTILSILFSTILLANNINIEIKNQKEPTEKQQISKSSELEEVQQRGCCSWHGGVSGCSNGKIVCNDGTYSPSCTCAIPVNPLG